MTKEHTPGQDCNCHAYGENECGCGADWTPSEVYELREKLAAERALADRLAEALMSTDSIIRKEVSLIGQWSSPDVCKEALAAWKEVRKEH